MGAIRILWSFPPAGPPYYRRMHPTATEDTRILTVVLPEADWRALREAEPDAVGWIQRQIRSRLSANPPGTSDDSYDEY